MAKGTAKKAAKAGKAGEADTAAASSPRLPAGRHGLPREFIVENQRERIVTALVDTVAERGYNATTVAHITKAASVSRRTFYEHFASKQACFEATFDTGMRVVIDTLDAALAGIAGRDWRELVRVSLRAYLEMLAAYPAVAWSMEIEALNAGPELYRRNMDLRSMIARRWAGAYELARTTEPGLDRDLPDQIFELLVGGIDDRIRHCLRTRGATALPELLPLLTEASFIVFGAPSEWSG